MQEKMTRFFGLVQRNKDNLDVIVFICSVAYCFQSTILAQVLVGAAWVARAAIAFWQRYRKDRGIPHKKECVFVAVLFLAPQIVIHLYTVLLVILGATDPGVLSTNAVSYMAVFLVIASIFLFGKAAMGYLFCALAFSWFLCLIRNVFVHGFGIILDAIAQGWFGASVGHENYLELDAVVLSVGYYLVYYLFSTLKTKKNSLPLTIMFVVIGLVGVKRIVLLAFVLVVACYLLIRKMEETKAHKIAVIAGWCAAALCLGFIFLLSQGNLFYQILDKFGIESMARDYFYKSIMSKTEFSLGFWGYGRGGVKLAMTSQFSGYSFVHSDIIKMFFELGLILFVGWLYFNLVFVAKCFEKEYGKSAAIMYLFVMACTFVLYVTDNTESYFVCIVIRTILPMGYVMSARKTEDNKIRKL